MASKDWLQTWLTEYYLWWEKVSGYPTQSTLYRVVAGEVTEPFLLGVPHIDPPYHWMTRLNLAMNSLREEERSGKYIWAMQLHYVLGHKQAREKLGMTETTFRRWKNTGERLLKAELEGRG